MLKIDRSEVKIPPSLSSEQARHARSAVEQVLILDVASRSQRRAPIEPSIYLASDVRAALQKLASGKCAFCETPVGDSGLLDVHHFRPISNATDARGTSADHHYAWLAYEWGNLYPACTDCNRSKRSLFPVSGLRAPVLCSLDEAREFEAGTIVDPGYDEPTKHLTFDWNGECRWLTERGRSTIQVFALNRPKLVQSRKNLSLELIPLIKSMLKKERNTSFGELYLFISPEEAYSFAKKELLSLFTESLAEKLGREMPRQADLVHRLLDFLNEADSSDLEWCFQRIEELSTRTTSDEQLADIYESPPAYYAAKARAPSELHLRAMGFSPKGVVINNFKAIGSIKLDFPEQREAANTAPCLMLLGENATGKSSILEAISLALLGARLAADVAGKPSAYLRRKNVERWGLVDAEPAIVQVPFYGMKQPAEIRIDPIRQVFEGSDEPASIVLAYGPRRFFSPKKTSRSRSLSARVQSLFEPMATIGHPSRWLQNLRQPEFDAVARALREILSLHFNDEITRDEQLGVCVRADGFLTPLDRLSEGYKSLFAMSVDIIRELLSHWKNLEEAQAVVLIDEIETHLHPRWKMQVMSSLRKALPRVTFVVTTHDPLCLRGLDDGEVQVLHRDENRNIEKLLDLPSIKGMRSEQLLTSDYFGLSSTADPAIEKQIAEYANAIAIKPSERSQELNLYVERVGRELADTLMLGENAVEQVVQEALKAYLDSRRGAPAALRTEARRNAASAILTAFKTLPRA